RVVAELLPVLTGLAGEAKDAGIGFTIDAEEADRLEPSLDLVEALALAPELAGWDGLGLAVQAYQKRAPAVIDWLADLAVRARRPTARSSVAASSTGRAGSMPPSAATKTSSPISCDGSSKTAPTRRLSIASSTSARRSTTSSPTRLRNWPGCRSNRIRGSRCR